MAINYAEMAQADMVAAAKLGAKGKGGSLLLQMAMVLGEIADKMAKECIDLAKQLDGPGGKASENTLTAQLQALTQQMNMFIQAMTNCMKTMGEADANLARKG